jgi:hypothetical protein
MKRIILAVGTASLLSAAGIPGATSVFAAPAPAATAGSVPAEAPCLPLPVVGLACGALGELGHVVPTPNIPPIPGVGRN